MSEKSSDAAGAEDDTSIELTEEKKAELRASYEDNTQELREPKNYAERMFLADYIIECLTNPNAKNKN